MFNLPHELTPNWESPDASAFRAFLATVTGQKLFPLLLDARPSLRGDTLEAAGLQGKLVEGFDTCLKTLSQFCATTQNNLETPTAQAYPSLTDDSQWSGPKLSETKE